MFQGIIAAMLAIAYNPAMNGIYGGDPREASKQVKQGTDPNAPYVWTLGEKLTGDRLEQATEELERQTAILYWLGDTELAAKYGASTPQAGLTPVELERWNRIVGVHGAYMGRLTEVLAESMNEPEQPPDALRGKVDERKVDERKADERKADERKADEPVKTDAAKPTVAGPNADIFKLLVAGLDDKGKADLRALLG